LRLQGTGLFEQLPKLELTDVHKKNIFINLETKNHVASGDTDLALTMRNDDGETSLGERLVSPIELKTKVAPISKMQLVFEIVAASRVSKFKQNVVGLGTDLQAGESCKWSVVYFVEKDKIVIKNFKSPVQALEFFVQRVLLCKTLSAISEKGDDEGDGDGGDGEDNPWNGSEDDGDVDDKQEGGSNDDDDNVNTTLGDGPSSESGDDSDTGTLDVIKVLEQDLSGSFPDSEVAAFETEQYLHMFKLYLEQESGENIRVPSWVHA
jgi:hypothetical protein